MHTSSASNSAMVNLDKVSLERKGASHNVVSKLNEADQLWAMRGNKNVALKRYQEAYDLAQVAENEMLQATVGMGLGYGLLEVGLPKQALDKFTFAYEVAQKNGNTEQSSAANEFISIALQNIHHAEVLQLLAETKATKGSLLQGPPVNGSAAADVGGGPFRRDCAADQIKVAFQPGPLPPQEEEEADAVQIEQQMLAADRHMEDLLHSEVKLVRIKRKHKQKAMKKMLKAEEAMSRLEQINSDPSNVKAEPVQLLEIEELTAWTPPTFMTNESPLNVNVGASKEDRRRDAKQAVEAAWKAAAMCDGIGSPNCTDNRNGEPSTSPGLKEEEEVQDDTAHLEPACLNREQLLRQRMRSTLTGGSRALPSTLGQSECAQLLSQSSNVSEPMYIAMTDEQDKSNAPLPGADKQGLKTRRPSDEASNSTCDPAEQSDASVRSMSPSGTCRSVCPKSQMTGLEPAPGFEAPPGLELSFGSSIARLQYPGSIDAPIFAQPKYVEIAAPMPVGSDTKFAAKNQGAVKVDGLQDFFFKRPIPKFCPYCGHGCKPNFRSCGSCGASISWIMQG